MNFKYARQYNWDGIEFLYYNKDYSYTPKSGVNFTSLDDGQLKSVPSNSLYGFCKNYKRDERDTLLEERCNKLGVDLLIDHYGGGYKETQQNKIVEMILFGYHPAIDGEGFFCVGEEKYKVFDIYEGRYSTPYYKNLGFINPYYSDLHLYRTGDINSFFVWQKRRTLLDVITKLDDNLIGNEKIIADAYNNSLWTGIYTTRGESALERSFIRESGIQGHNGHGIYQHRHNKDSIITRSIGRVGDFEFTLERDKNKVRLNTNKGVFDYAYNNKGQILLPYKYERLDSNKIINLILFIEKKDLL